MRPLCYLNSGSRSVALVRRCQSARMLVHGGVGMPWNLLACTAIGVWLMFYRALLGAEGTSAATDHLIGALVVTVSVIAFSEVARAAWYANAEPGNALIVAAATFGDDGPRLMARIICALAYGPATRRSAGYGFNE